VTARRRWAVVALAAVALTSLAAGAPHALRRFDGFHVRHVEVRGVHLLDPAAALAASRIPATATVFDDFAPWRDSLLTHPLVAAAHVGRRLPDTIVLEIRETQPLAFVRTPELRPVDARGRVLPVAPGTPLDLPVLDGVTAADAAGRITGAVQHALLVTLARIRASQPLLAEWISEAAPAGRDAVRLRLRWPEAAEVLLPAEPTADRLAQLALVFADLAAAPDTADELARLRRIDARFRDQVVVSIAGGAPPRTNSSGGR
jgi:cell division septal protein FtsQ